MWQTEQTQLERNMEIALKIGRRSFEKKQVKMEELATKGRVLRIDLQGLTAELLHSKPMDEVMYYCCHACVLLELSAFLSSVTLGRGNLYSNHCVRPAQKSHNIPQTRETFHNLNQPFQ